MKTVSDFHILVEQDVQKISSFAYEDMLPEEVDVQANKAFYLWLDEFASFQPRGNRMDDTEARLNDIRTLVVRDSPLSLVTDGGVSVASFPDNYLYLVGIKLNVWYECSVLKQKNILPNRRYVLKSETLDYNGDTYNKGDMIIGTTTSLLGKLDVVYQLSERVSVGRIVRNEDETNLSDTYYGKTHYKSPIVVVSEEGISVLTSNFFVDTAKAIYIREPINIDSSTPNTEIDLPINGYYKLAQKTVEAILKVTEQGQQKIENLKLTK